MKKLIYLALILLYPLSPLAEAQYPSLGNGAALIVNNSAIEPGTTDVQFEGGVTIAPDTAEFNPLLSMSPEQSVTIGGTIKVPTDNAHFGKTADIFAVGFYSPVTRACSGQSEDGQYYMLVTVPVDNANRDDSTWYDSWDKRATRAKTFEEWDGSLDSLKPFQTDVVLNESTPVPIITNSKFPNGIQGFLCIAFGYRVTDTNGTNTWVFNDNMVNVTFSSATIAEGILTLGDTPIGNAEVDLYLGEEQSTVVSTTTDSEGQFAADLSAQMGHQLEQGTLLKTVVTKEGKTLRGLVLDYSTEDGVYTGNDMAVSHYSEAVFQMAEAFSLDMNAIVDLYRSFLKAYQGGEFNFNHRRAQEFAFFPVLQEVADNIKANFISNAPLLSPEEIRAKMAGLNRVDPQTFASNTYALPLIYETVDKTIVQVVSFETNGLLDKTPFTVNAEIFQNNDSAFYDEATSYVFNISPEVILEDVKITTYDPQSEGTLIDEEYYATLSHGEQHSVIKNNRFELVLEPELQNGMTTRQKPDVMDTSGIHYDAQKGKFVAKIYIVKSLKRVFAESGINIRFFLAGDFFPFAEYEVKFSNLVEMNEYYLWEQEFSIPDSTPDKHRALSIWFREGGDENKYTLARAYDFADWGNDYDNATIAKFTMSQTRSGRYPDDKGYANSGRDNEFVNKKGQEDDNYGKVPTHRLLDFDKIVNKDINYHDDDEKFYWKESQYAKEIKANFDNNDTRTPLLLIHGWQGDKGQENQAALLHPENTEFQYWRNFINYYLSQPELYDKYRLYLYHYPSYKHVTFNARMLALLLDEVKESEEPSPLSSALQKNEPGIVIVAHSMGGLIARSLIEEYQALGKIFAIKLKRLITLDTPHHGSPSSLTIDIRPEAGSNVKNLGTPGAASLYWDNYDNQYPVTTSQWHETDWEEIERERKEVLGEKTEFDDHYYHKLASKDKRYKVNPFLAFLNENFESKAAFYARAKYIFYVAHLSPDTFGDNENDPIVDDAGQNANKEYINDVGYASGGAEPVCSAFLSNKTEVDNQTRFEPEYQAINAYVDINDEGYEGNYNIPFRWFWDYNHEMIMNGAYSEKGEWDAYIDGDKSRDCGEYTAFRDLKDGLGCRNMRAAYINSVLFGFSGQDESLVERVAYDNSETFVNPLTTEPVFRAIKSDLLGEVPPIPGCRAHFTGLIFADHQDDDDISEVYVEDNASEYVGAGSYPDNTLAFPKAVARTFDGIAIDAGTKVTIYSGKNFEGDILYEKIGPAILNNGKWKDDNRYGPNVDTIWKEPLESNYPPSVREWSTTNMHGWSNGSVIVECGYSSEGSQ